MGLLRSGKEQIHDATSMRLDSREQVLPIVLVLDTSQSMKGPPIAALNAALTELAEEMREDLEISNKAEVAVISFGDGGVVAWRGNERMSATSTQAFAPGINLFVPVDQMLYPQLEAAGVTPMVEALDLAMRCVADRKAELKRNNRNYFCPLIWLISDGIPTGVDGQPTDAWRELPPKISEAERAHHFCLFTVSAGDISSDGDMVLRELGGKGHLRLKGFSFKDALAMVTKSAQSVAHGDTVDAIKDQVVQKYRQIELQM